MSTEGWKPPQNSGKQIILNFEVGEDRKMVCEKYNVPDNANLVKRPDGEWYYNDQLVADYKLMMDRLYEGNDNSELFNRNPIRE